MGNYITFILFSIVDTSGEKYFDLLTTDLMDDSMKLVDAKGRDIACIRKERLGPGKRAHITIKKDGENCLHIYNFMSFIYSGIWSRKSEG